ncbi:unnamed protein product, partial [Ceratitis capitata]
ELELVYSTYCTCAQVVDGRFTRARADSSRSVVHWCGEYSTVRQKCNELAFAIKVRKVRHKKSNKVETLHLAYEPGKVQSGSAQFSAVAHMDVEYRI